VVVVDGGGWPTSSFDFGQRVVAPFLWSRGVERLAVVAASHAHPDHAGGLPFLARWFAPGRVWTNGEPPQGGPYGRLLAQARRAGVPVEGPEAISRLVELDGARLFLVWPRPGRPLPAGENDRSLWLGLGLGQSWLWLPGDAGPAVERRAAAWLPPGRHALVAAHHGGKGSCSRELLARLAPEVVVFSCGCANRYGFPRPEVLSRVRASGAAVFSTARHGCLTLTTAGQGWRVRPYLASPRSCPR
jgi:competence protein ComEC